MSTRKDDGMVHFSNLKLMGQSPAHYRWSLDHGFSSDATDKGLAVHSMVLGGDRVRMYAARRAGPAWKEFEADNGGCIILKGDAHTEAVAMAMAVEKHPAASDLLDGHKECLVNWKRAGRDCSSRLDVWNHNKRRIVDLKTCRSANPEHFARTAIRMGYHAQLAWYLDAAAWLAALQEDQCMLLRPPVPTEAFIVAVESKPPYPVVVWKLTERALEAGRACCTAWFERLMVCESEDHWPGYTDAVQTLDVEEEEKELEFEDVEVSDVSDT